MKAMRVMESPNMETEAPSQKAPEVRIGEDLAISRKHYRLSAISEEAPARSAFDRAIAAGFEHLRHAVQAKTGARVAPGRCKAASPPIYAGAGARPRPSPPGAARLPGRAGAKPLDEKQTTLQVVGVSCRDGRNGSGQSGEIAA